ncbi:MULTISPECIES: DUF3592 domain-containing protein [Niastella]|uniref:DUF3592 domain-containing protein n=1 Tax=Niastella soli TaxID=2821487 RepID=A0ABS3YWJ6_9BACT|nr:DUF3592 domain-containing protein [Niastella soli]MBO9202295.1 hypothetical protein [Niastella soli]
MFRKHRGFLYFVLDLPTDMEYAYFIAGTLFLIFGLFFLKDRITFLKYGIEAYAIVIRIEVSIRDTEDGKRTTYIPHFKVVTHDHTELIFTHGSSEEWGRWSIGDQIKVVYNDSFPGDVVVCTPWEKYRKIIILLTLAIISFIIACLYLVDVL